MGNEGGREGEGKTGRESDRMNSGGERHTHREERERVTQGGTN